MTKIDEDTYSRFLSSIISGSRSDCSNIVESIMERDVPLKNLYIDIFQKSLYRIGELWEFNKISVAVEHMATSITEGLMNQIYARIISGRRIQKKIIVCSVENELHQVGGKMVADMFEMYGWDAMYLGANTPTNELIRFIRETNPDAVGLSLSVYFHIGSLEKMLTAIRDEFPDIKILIGGQAFRFGGESIADKYSGVIYIPSLNELEEMLKRGEL